MKGSPNQNQETSGLLVSDGGSDRPISIGKYTAVFVGVLLLVAVVLVVVLPVVLSSSNQGSDHKHSQNLKRVCSDKGYIFPDTNECECFPCHEGTDCSRTTPNCVIDTARTSLPLLSAYWNQNEEMFVEPQSYRIPYEYSLQGVYTKTSSCSGLRCPFRDALFALHDKFNNIEAYETCHIVGGVGKEMLVAGINYVYSQNRGNIVNEMYSEAPYSKHNKEFCDFTDKRCKWSSSNPTESNLFEVVLAPSYTTGKYGERQFTSNNFWIEDNTLNWPLWRKGDLSREAPIHVFDMEAITGQSSMSFGWACFRDSSVARAVSSYINANTIHISVDTVFRTFTMIEKVLENSDNYISWINNEMNNRWSVIKQIFENNKEFTIDSEEGTPFLWVKCSFIDSAACVAHFSKYEILVASGSDFGMTGVPGHVRINLGLHEDTFSILTPKLRQAVGGDYNTMKEQVHLPVTLKDVYKPLTAVDCVNGIVYPDTGTCTCYPCYTQTDCSVFNTDCRVSASSGMPYLMSAWFNENRERLNIPDVVSPTNYRFDENNLGIAALGSENTPGLLGALKSAIIAAHNKFGNILEPEKKYLVLGTGARQLTAAAFYAVSKQLQDTVQMYVRRPYYSAYKPQCDKFAERCVWNSDDPDPKRTFEILTTPNNPTGDNRDPSVPGQFTYMRDHAYYWPWFVPYGVEKKDAPIIVHTFTKMTGHAATRFGWAWVKDKATADLMAEYVTTQSKHVSITAAYRALRIFQFMATSGGDEFNKDVKAILKEFWDGVILASEQNPNNGFEIESIPYTCYFWLKCNDLTNGECYNLFAGKGITGQRGNGFGMGGTSSKPGYYRINLTLEKTTLMLVRDRVIEVLKGNTKQEYPYSQMVQDDEYLLSRG